MWYRGKGESAAYAVCVWPTAQEGVGKRRTRNMAPMFVTLEVSKLSGWLKAVANCRVRRGHTAEGNARVAGRCVAQGEGRTSCARGVRVAHTAQEWVERWRRRKCTRNMSLMSVTPEVSQLEMSVLKFVNQRKSWLMSVMDETSQSAMRPYVAVAAVGFASNAPTAVLTPKRFLSENPDFATSRRDARQLFVGQE